MKKITVIKRSGQEVGFDIEKIKSSMRRALQDASDSQAISEGRMCLIADEIARMCEASESPVHTDKIQEAVEDRLIDLGSKRMAKKYILHRYERELSKMSVRQES